ncbi:GPI transamidase component GAA1 [Penicillium ucsense]|uniref:GPI transamidase component GAA1 n=1 Tax=Penicillium ucsense TaxID=2839758 RepID=A0A8J8WI28_9EURO|nr:GPI transamidase component GAA1 [Penicillium ucsense]KAF7733139.1 GPI transamidase component GAA1 [Penicillium ucsense]
MTTPAALPPLPFNPGRVRSYVLRLPLFTRLVLLVILVFWLLELQTVWSVVTWGALIPNEINIGTMYRLNTYPLIHTGFFHAALNVLALTPLLERFEAEHGTLTSIALFVGPLSTFPGGLYTVIERFLLKSNTQVIGSSVWVFLLLGSEAIRTFKSSPYFSLGPYKIPTWTSPLFACAVLSILVSSASFLGHICAILIGYLFGLGYLKVFVPPEKVLRWIEGKLNLLGRLPHYVSVDQKTFGRYGVLPSVNAAATIRSLRNNPQFLFGRLPNIFSFLCIVVGVAWLLLLPLDEYSRQTYISENALLPGQVHAYFTGSEQNIFRGYKKELQGVIQDGREQGPLNPEVVSTPEISNKISSILRDAGLKVATQKYEYKSAGITYQGENVYGIIHAPRGDATEAIVLVAAWKTADDELNLNGVTLALTLARYFRRWSLWSKDIILVFPPDSKTGTQAWIDAYHDLHPASVQPLPLKSGALQGALVIEYPFEHHFRSLHIVYDGVNGQLPNLDLFNTAVAIASGQMGMGANLQEMLQHDNSYQDRLKTMMRSMTKQGLGYATGAHSSFMPYHIDAITLQPKGEGWEDEMALGRTIESLCRSLNNLLEHLHQSFFFYLLMQTNRFVSIGTYLPSAMLIAGNFTIMAIALWMRSGYHSDGKSTLGAGSSETGTSKSDEKAASLKGLEGDQANLNGNTVAERVLALPLTLVSSLHLLGLLPLWTFNTIFHQYFLSATYAFVLVDLLLPLTLAAWLSHGLGVSKPFIPQQYLLVKSFALLILGLCLSTLATLNFSLSFMIGLLCAPLSFVTRVSGSASTRYPVAVVGLVLMNVLSPPAVLLGGSWFTGVSIETVLTQAAFGWDVWGMWTQVVVWCVWWPAWLTGCVLLGSSLF